MYQIYARLITGNRWHEYHTNIKENLYFLAVLMPRCGVKLQDLLVKIFIELHDCCLVATAIAVVGCREKRQDTCAKKNKSQNFLWRTRAAEYARYSALDGS